MHLIVASGNLNEQMLKIDGGKIFIKREITRPWTDAILCMQI